MKNKKKVILILAFMVLIVVLMVILLSILNKKPKNKNKVINLGDVFNTIELKDSQAFIDVEENNEVLEKFDVDRVFIDKRKVMLNQKEGQIFYLRGSLNQLNIYKACYEFSQEMNTTEQFNKFIKEFTNFCKEYLGLSESDEPVSAQVIDEYKESEPLPLSESIINYKGVYTQFFEIKESDKVKSYEINYYIKDDKLICEFVKFL